jgi:hypothetical protein
LTPEGGFPVRIGESGVTALDLARGEI